MAELFENIDMHLLTQLNRMSLGDYMKFADKKQYKQSEIKEHFYYIKEYLKSMVSILFKTWTQSFVGFCLGILRLTLI
jgi:hypothetical protein